MTGWLTCAGPSGVTTDVGGVASLDGVAAIRPDWRVAGWTPMSASKLTVACRMRVSVAVTVPSCVASRPRDHRTVPELKTSEPRGARYMVTRCVTGGAPG